MPATPDDEGFILHTNKRPRTSSNSSHGTSSPRSPDGLYTARIVNLPPHLRTNRSLYPILCKIDTNITNVHVLRYGAVLVSGTDKDLVSKLHQLVKLSDTPELQITPFSNDIPRTPSSRKPTYSCVVTGVDLDVTTNEIEERLTELQLPFKKTWRITSRATNKETRLVRIISEDQRTINQLLECGFPLYFRVHRVEPSHTSRPQPIPSQLVMASHQPQPNPEILHQAQNNNQQAPSTDNTAEPAAPMSYVEAVMGESNKKLAAAQEHQKKFEQKVQAAYHTLSKDVKKDRKESENDLLEILTHVLLRIMPEKQHKKILELMEHYGFNVLAKKMILSRDINNKPIVRFINEVEEENFQQEDKQSQHN